MGSWPLKKPFNPLRPLLSYPKGYKTLRNPIQFFQTSSCLCPTILLINYNPLSTHIFQYFQGLKQSSSSKKEEDSRSDLRFKQDVEDSIPINLFYDFINISHLES